MKNEEQFLNNLQKSYGIDGIAKRLSELQCEMINGVRHTGMKGCMTIKIEYNFLNDQDVSLVFPKLTYSKLEYSIP